MKKKLYIKIFSSILILLFMAVLISNPKKSVEVTLDAIKLWVAVVVPSIFPYAVLTTMLTSLNILSLISRKATPLTKRIWNTNGISLYAFIISVFSGYPIGSKTVADLKNNGYVSKSDAVRCACFCSSASPMFVIGSIGAIMLNNLNFGIILFISHFLATLCVSFIFRFFNDTNELLDQRKTPVNVDNLIYQSVYSGIISILVVGGIITLCYLLCYTLSDLKILTPLTSLFTVIFKDEYLADGFIKSLIEITCGAKIMANSTSKLLLPLLSFSISFGGFSVIAQSVSLLKTAKIKTAPFVLSKLTQAVISFIITLILSLLRIY